MKMLQTAQAFVDEMAKKNVKCRQCRDLENGDSLVSYAIKGKNNAQYEIFFIFQTKEPTVCMRVFKLITFPEDRTARIYDAMNELNRKFRWLKFFCDDDCNVHVQEDEPLSAETAGPFCVGMLVRAIGIIEKAYPDLMRALWA